MKAITVVLEVSPTGEVIREVFTMVHQTMKAAEKRQRDLPKQFCSGKYKTQWEKPRVKLADSVHARGNTINAQSYLFG
jgi:hypothetical protein